jgi:hypothetical protein
MILITPQERATLRQTEDGRISRVASAGQGKSYAASQKVKGGLGAGSRMASEFLAAGYSNVQKSVPVKQARLLLYITIGC